MRLGVPFIAPRQLGAVGDQHGRLSLPSIEWRTGQCGVPSDNHCSLSGAQSPSISGASDHCSSGLVAHWTLSGAHRTVWCTQPTVGASRVDRADGRWHWRRWLTGQSVHHRTVWWIIATSPFSFPESDEFVADDSPDSPMHHRTVRWIIAVQLRRFPRAASSPLTSLGHRTLSGAPPDCPVCQAELELVVHNHLFFNCNLLFLALFLTLSQTH
jgi:hypothetical protein